MKKSTIRQSGGFTLIEVMIVVAIVAILASIALPAYNDQIKKSRRTDAQRELVSYAQQLERWFSTNGTYLNGAGTACGVAYGGASAHYGVVGACTATTFTITATPVSGTSQAADGTQTLDEKGTRDGSVDSGNWKI